MDADLKAMLERAFYAAQERRPYKADRALIKALLPPGGEWVAVAPPGAICRSVMWGLIEVAHVNPAGNLSDLVEGQIAMGLRATPLIDRALRTIMVLAEDPANLAIIREIAEAAIVFIEMPAPALKERDEEEGEEG